MRGLFAITFALFTFAQVPEARGPADRDAAVEGMVDRCTRAGLEGRQESLRRQNAALNRVVAQDLPGEDQDDRLVLLRVLREELEGLESIRTWERDPGYYRKIISRGLSLERMSQIPAVLVAARENLNHPSRPLTEISIQEFAALRRPLEVDPTPSSPKFQEERKSALAALDAFVAWMGKELLPKAVEAGAEPGVRDPQETKNLEARFLALRRKFASRSAPRLYEQ